MRVTILACDYCVAVVPAVGTRRLVDDQPRKGDPEISLCKRHLNQLLRAFQPKRRDGQPGFERQPVAQRLHAVEEKRRKDRDRKRAKAAERKGRSDKGKRRSTVPWVERQGVVLSLIPSVGGISARELQRQVLGTQKLAIGPYKQCLKMLKARGMVTMRGSRSTASYFRAVPVERASA
jgi:hypothetical protein